MPSTPSSSATTKTEATPARQQVHLRSLTLPCSAKIAFDLFQNAQNYPRFMEGIDEVEPIEPDLIRCTGYLHKNPAKVEEWMVRIVNDERYMVIGWQILDMGLDVSGAVRFDDIEAKAVKNKQNGSEKASEAETGRRCCISSHFAVEEVEAEHRSINYIRQVLNKNGRTFRQKVQQGELVPLVVLEEARNNPGLQARFEELADRWERETAHLFSGQEKLRHPACREIAGLGQEVIPLIVQDLPDRKGEWLMLLVEMTGLKIGQGKTVEEAEREWGQWAKTFFSTSE